MDITQILVATTSNDAGTRQAAESQLQAVEAQSLGVLLGTLTSELANEAKPAESRRLAGILTKNYLTAKESTRKQQVQQKWIETVDAQTRDAIKTAVLNTLRSTVQPARRAAAQVISTIAGIEVPRGMWPALIEILLRNVTASTSQDAEREGSLETLGYICEEIDANVLRSQADGILTAVVFCMGPSMQNDNIKYAAVVALYNSLEFVRANFSVKAERDAIMRELMQTCQYKASQGSKRIREAAYEVLVKIVTLYYEHLQDYMELLFRQTFEAMATDESEIVQQAVEFWSSLCDEEVGMIEGGQAPKYFIQTALPFLVPQLLNLLTRQEEDPDEETWDVAMASGTCLSLVSACVKDQVIGHVMPYVQANINEQHWRQREAATMAFGCILDGPSKEQLAVLVQQGVPILLTRMKDPNLNVKDTAAWALGRLCEFQGEAIPAETYPTLIQGIIEGLNDDPRVANHAAWAVHNICEANEDDSLEPTGRMSHYWGALATQLLTTASREDADERGLRTACYEALNMLVQCAPQDMLPNVLTLLPEMVTRLQTTFQMQILSQDDRNEQCELQALICGCLQALTQKVEGQIAQYANTLMTCYLQMFNQRNTTLNEETFLAIGALANALEGNFLPYVQHFLQPLKAGLASCEEYQVCSICVGVVGDLCRALNEQMAPFTDELLQQLLTDLQNPALDRSVKPSILAAFGDIALAIGGQFEKYLPFVIPMLQQAAAMPVNADTLDNIDFLNSLREGIFEGYTGIIQGLKSGHKEAAFLPYVEHVVGYAEHVSRDANCSSDLVRVMVGVLGDIAHALGSHVKSFVQRPFVQTLLQQCHQSSDEQAQETAQWAQGKIVGL
eukprot:TRINITY_DN4646_c0_g1_i1.p1 TRINITY_DN4646_c0_g1~~TRINITY_DN4646_c0_g1_i1.p1  ORF type:complete len:848 (-),score=205.25 TRINITY_DN4646_c0_g1_i1:134-2677(-)